MLSAEVVVVEVPQRHLYIPYYVIVRFRLLTKEMECFEQTYPSITHISAVRAFPPFCVRLEILYKSASARHSPGEDDMPSLHKDGVT